MTYLPQPLIYGLIRFWFSHLIVSGAKLLETVEGCDQSLIALLPLFALYGGGHFPPLIHFSSKPCVAIQWPLDYNKNKETLHYSRFFLKIAQQQLLFRWKKKEFLQMFIISKKCQEHIFFNRKLFFIDDYLGITWFVMQLTKNYF